MSRALTWANRRVAALAVLAVIWSSPLAWAAGPELQLHWLADGGGARITASGPRGQIVRLERSADLDSWQSLATRYSATGLVEFADTNPQLERARFYRAIQWQAPGGLQTVQASGNTGARVEVFGGAFAASPGDHVALVGGVPARVLEADTDRLLIEVPAGAVSGPIQVVTPSGVQTMAGRFTVTVDAPVEFDLPGGLDPAGMEVASPYGGDASVGRPSPAGDSRQVRVRAGEPQVVFAVPRDPDRAAFFCAVSVSGGAPLRFSAASTAEALVFLSPLLTTRDAAAAAAILEALRTEPKVQALARLIAELFPQPGDPFASDAFRGALREAVLAAGRSPALRTLAQHRRTVRLQGAPPPTSRTASLADLDLDFTSVQTQANDPEAGLGPRDLELGSRGLNPVDWFASVRRVDVAAAFPKGAADLGRAAGGKLTLGLDPKNPVGYPLLGSAGKLRAIEADLAFGRFDLLGYFTDQIPGLLKPEEKLELPDESAVHLVRTVGPAFSLLGFDEETKQEAGFLAQDREGLRVARARSLALNVIAMGVDLVGAIVDLRQLGEDAGGEDVAEILSEVFVDLVAKAPGFQDMGDVLEALFDTQIELLTKLGGIVADAGLKRVLTGAAKELAKTGVETATGVLEVLSVIGSFGEVGERLSGFLRTTPMESAFVVVGDPFALDVLGVDPAEGGPGDTIRVTIAGGVFDPASPRDHVYLIPAELNDGAGIENRVTAVEPLGEGKQRLTITLAEGLQRVAEGPQRLLVTASGRRGASGALFSLKRRPRVVRMGARQGFAAVDDFLGAPYPGTEFSLVGFDFGPDDAFFFGGVRATETSGIGGGGALVRVPKGAGSGPIRVERRVSDTDVRVGESPPFTAVGPPILRSAQPASGPIGTVLGFEVSHAGGPDGLTGAGGAVRVNGTIPAETAQLRNALRAIVPLDAPTGLVEVTVHTPAGVARTPFVVTPGLAAGAELTVGQLAGCAGPILSPLTLAAALEIAAGQRLPADDLDETRDPASGGFLENLDLGCMWEEGDFVSPDLSAYVAPGSGTVREPEDMRFRWPVGAEYADRILVTEGTGELAGEFTFAGSFDSLYLESLAGSVRLTGTNNTLIATSFRGLRLVIEGSHNTVRGSFELAEGIEIRGHQNVLSGTVEKATRDGVLILGDGNEVEVTARDNGGSGVVIDGGSFNRVMATTGRNGGNGVTVRGGARANQVSVRTGVPFGAGVQPGTGNAGHGVLVTGGAKLNLIAGMGPIGGNGGDGVRLEGDGLEGNELTVLYAADNGGNGFTLGAGALGTRLPAVSASHNGADGLHFEGARGTVAGLIHSGFNRGDGVAIIDVDDGLTTLESVELRDNRQAGLRLAGGTSRLQLEGMIELGGVGARLEGSGVTGNRLALVIRGCTGSGVELVGATANDLDLEVRDCGGHGVLALGAGTNRFELHAEGNQGDGLRLGQGSHGNEVQGRFFKNQSGIVVSEGSTGNALHGLQADRNRAHGVHLTGAGTRANAVSGAIGNPAGAPPPGNALDGIRLDDGASDNAIGGPGREVFVSGSGAVGVRVAGPGTTANRLVNAVIASAPGEPPQPAAIVVENGAADTLIGGPEALEHNTISGNAEGLVIRDGAHGTLVVNCEFSDHAGAGVRLLDALDTSVGGAAVAGVRAVVPGPDGGLPALTWGNLIANNQVGIQIGGAASRNNAVRANTLFENVTAVRVEDASGTRLSANSIGDSAQHGVELVGATDTELQDNAIADNAGAGVRLSGATTSSRLSGNRICGNQTGVAVVGAAARRNAIAANAIYGNTGPGIAVVGGGNDGRPAPRIDGIGTHSVSGTADAPDFSEVEVFRDWVGARDEGLDLIARGRVRGGRFNARLRTPLHLPDVGVAYALNATVTDTNRSTSEFGGLTGGAAGGAPVVFTSTRDGNAELYLARGLLDEPVRLTHDPGADTAPALAPDGSRVAFVSTRFGNPEICLLTLRGTNPVVRLTAHPAADEMPAWSADGTKLAFVSERDGNPELYTMNADGTELVRLTTEAAADLAPSWSPDGQRLVFASQRSGNWELWTVDADGARPQVQFAHPAADRQPAWSADGTRVVFVSARDGNDEVYVGDFESGVVTRVTDHPAADVTPAWLTPETLLFASDRDAGLELYRVPSPGGLADRLTVSAGDNWAPHAGR